MYRNLVSRFNYSCVTFNRILRKMTVLILAVGLMNFNFIHAISYASEPTAGQELRAMGLIEGRSGGDLAEEAYLSRTEMMVVLSRLMGAYREASTWTRNSSFIDQNNHWGEPYVAYAQYKRWTAGIGSGMFGYEQRTTVQQASVFMLKALGYSSPRDFVWETAFDKAKSLGLFKDLSIYPNQMIRRGDLFKLIMNTLEANKKEMAYTLGESLGAMVGESTADNVATSRTNMALAAVRIGDKWGYMGSDKKLAIRFMYDDALDFSEGVAAVAIEGKYGYIDKVGRMILDPIYEDAGNFVEGLAPVRISGKYGYIDKRGNFDIPAKYDYADQFSEGLARVVISGELGYVNSRGMIVIPIKFDQANRFVNSIAAVKENTFIGYINSEGVQVIAPQYLIYGEASDGLIRFNSADAVGFMNLKGEVMIPARFVWADNFSEGLAVVQSFAEQSDYTFNYINTKGDRPFTQNYQDAYKFSEDLAFVMANGKYGIINKTGAYVVQPVFTMPDINGFSNGFARITEKSGVGYIDRNGNIVIAPQFDEGRPFSK